LSNNCAIIFHKIFFWQSESIPKFLIIFF
jgi:hypothetical protein